MFDNDVPFPFTFSKATNDRVQARIAETQAALNWSETKDVNVVPLENGRVQFRTAYSERSANILAEALRNYFTLRVEQMIAPGTKTVTDRYKGYKTIIITGDLAPQPPAPVETVLNQTTTYEVEMDSHGSLGKKVDEWHGVWEERRKFAIEALKDATVKETQQYWQGRVDAFTDVVGDLNTWYEHYLQ